jgi:purine-binding chemotaxis protein CheW
MAPDSLQVACFRLADLECAVDVLAVAEIVNPRPVNPVPGGPPGVEGLIELRGRFLPVIDLRRRLGLSAAAPAGKLIIARLGEARVALACDEVSVIERVPRSAIAPAPELGTLPLAPGYLVGVARWKEHVAYVLDLGVLFSEAEVAAMVAR